ncbi:MAG: helix-turn-helix domain-containing protein [Hungatella hathewayi]|uniref:HTH araC/xylS-type domain-containing protein n=1 Tax=Hungatella hathewayi WAL-18680 TaxID=742737 RepID=G5IC76_9FIRM|nr:AraC family transcriptional regulator [Hungatella hathewayi]EHI60994.1 hypothetical protein HMPREF9473_01059 [ [Hungatella hathewayi WAL-18680]MBS4984821.1 helix-turn-helix transcriptional regulator [Hungatella hathewayi]
MDEKQFIAQTLTHSLHIQKVVSAFYSDLNQDFVSRGEAHDFWEFVYVDRGCLQVKTSKTLYPLAQGQITFHPPMEYHRHIADLTQDTSLCIISFYCDNPVLLPLAGKTFHLEEQQRYLLSQTLTYGTKLFSAMVDSRDSLYLVRRENTPTEYDQVFTNYLELFLLLCVTAVQELKDMESQKETESALSRNRQAELAQQAVNYLVKHVTEQVTITQLCNYLGCAKTTLSTAFHAYTGSSIIPYFNRLKIETAKGLIRSRDLSLTEIASLLNFCNLNYFSTAFKNYTGMYPREYAKSLKIHNGVYLVNPEHDAILHDTGPDPS